MVSAKVSDPSVSLRLAAMVSGIAAPSLPEAAETERLGVLATPATATSSEALTELVVPFSLEVAVTPRCNVPLQPGGGAKLRPVRSPGARVQLPLGLSVP